MQIVIDINDNEYMGIMEYPNNITSYPVTIHLYDAVRNGTPLPKGHGDLKDADAIMNIIKENLQIRPEFVIEHAPTIIKADRSEE